MKTFATLAVATIAAGIVAGCSPAKRTSQPIPGTAAPASDARVAGTKFNATGTIPCSMTRGQPMGQCPFGVVRRGGGNGDVHVTKPDGRKRIISFEAGKAVGADTSEADPGRFSASKAGDMSTVRIGTETYQIPDAAVSGG